MAWNGLNNASIIRPDQKLLLQVHTTAHPDRHTRTALPLQPHLPRRRVPPPPRGLQHGLPQPHRHCDAWITTRQPWGGVVFICLLAVAGVILIGFVFRKKIGLFIPTPKNGGR